MEANGFGKMINDELGERLTGDLKLLAEDAKDVLCSTSDLAGKRLHEARTRLESTISSAREHFSVAEKRLIDGTRNALDTADALVQQHPWQAVGVGLVAGVVLGLLLGRRH